jgi:hypothetical protein
MARMTERVVMMREEPDPGDEGGEGTGMPGLELLPGQRKAASADASSARRERFFQDRRATLASRSQASQGGRVPLTRPSKLGTDPGASVRELLSAGPLSKPEILRALAPAALGDRQKFGPGDVAMALAKKFGGFSLDRWLERAAERWPDGKWKLRTGG